MIAPPIRPLKFYNYFMAECKNCGWKKTYRSDNILVPDKCPKCKKEVVLRVVKRPPKRNILEFIFDLLDFDLWDIIIKDREPFIYRAKG